MEPEVPQSCPFRAVVRRQCDAPGLPEFRNQTFLVAAKPMLRKTLGRTGLEVTQLGYGSMGIRGPRTWGKRVVSEDDAEAMLNLVLDAGINFIDT